MLPVFVGISNASEVYHLPVSPNLVFRFFHSA